MATHQERDPGIGEPSSVEDSEREHGATDSGGDAATELSIRVDDADDGTDAVEPAVDRGAGRRSSGGSRGSGTRSARGSTRGKPRKRKSTAGAGARQATLKVAESKRGKNAAKPTAEAELTAGLVAAFGVASLIGGPHWAIHEQEAAAIAAPAVKLSKRLEPYMPAIVDKLGPLAIAMDAASLAAVLYVVVKPRLDVSRAIAQAKKDGTLPPGARLVPVQAVDEPAAVRVDPAGVHRESATALDGFRQDAPLEGVEPIEGVTVAETDPYLLDRVAASGANLENADVDELRERVDAGPVVR